MPLNNTLKVICASAVVAVAVYVIYQHQQNTTQIKVQKAPLMNHSHSTLNIDPLYIPSDETHYFKTIEESGGLPIACVGTLGGDIMMCPSSGVCPLNGQRCQPQVGLNKPCCTDRYYPWQTTYSTV